MSNQQKAEFVNDNFYIQSFWCGHGEILPNSLLVPKGAVWPDFLCKPVKFPTVITHKWLTVWSHIMNHQKAKRVFYINGIRSFRSFGQSEAQKFSSVQPLFHPETEFSSKLDLQNSVTSKLFVG
jgi:hypothetical protein